MWHGYLSAILGGLWVTFSVAAASLAIPRGQIEAAQACGLSKSKVLTRIVLPQMVRHAIPGFSNNGLVMVKATALVQLFIVYYGFEQFEAMRDSVLWPLLREAWFCAWLVFALNTTAYATEIFAGALRATPVGEVEAARACGLTGLKLYSRILLPNTLRHLQTERRPDATAFPLDSAPRPARPT